MNPEDARLRFRQWLIDHELEPEVAYAILESMPPFDWSEIARRDEVALKADVDARFDGIDHRLDGIDQRLDRIDQRLDGIDQRFDSIDDRFVGVYERFDSMHAAFDAHRVSFESQLVALEGRLSMRWMETTRIIVFALITLFLGIAGVSIGLAQG